MELTSVRPYSFRKVRQVLDLHLSQVQRYLTRHSFTEEQYLSHSVPFNLSSVWFFLFKTGLNWSIILALLLTYTPLIPQLGVINMLLERTLNIKKIAFFNAAYLILFMLWEDACMYSFWVMVTRRFYKVEVIYHLRSNLDSELTRASRHKLVALFVRNTYAAGLCNKLSALGLLFVASQLVSTTVQLFQSGEIGAIELCIGIYFSVMVNIYFWDVMYALFSLVTGLFFIVKVFRMRLAICSATLKLASSFSSRRMFQVFTHQYIHLHGLINKYNFTIQEYVFCIDYAAKFATTFAIIYLAKQEKLTLSTCLLVVLYFIIYIYDVYLHFRLSHFATKNIQIYKHVADFAACNQWRAASLDSFRFGDKMFVSKSLFFRFKMDLLVHFLSNNLMGFTMGRQYFITKTKVVEDFLVNFYMFMLVYKKMKV